MVEPHPHQEFSELFAEAEQALYGFVFSLLPNRADADDVLQETVGQLWEHFDDYDPGRPFLPWACRFAYHQVLKHRRREQTQRRHFREAVVTQLAEAHPRQQNWSEAHHRAVEHCIRQLPAHDQQVVRARYFANSSMNDVAVQLGLSANSLYKQLQRARGKLQRCITRQLAREGLE